MKSIYMIGSLRNPMIGEYAETLRKLGWDVFSDWWSAGPQADDCWRDHERLKGNDQVTALESWASRHVFEFDKRHLDRCDEAVLILPAGKSCCIELGYMIGKGKAGFIVLDGDPDRYDVMFTFATAVFISFDEFITYMKGRELQ